MLKKWLGVAGMLVLVLGIAASAGANLIQNGDFQGGVLSPWVGTNAFISNDPSATALGMQGYYASLGPGNATLLQKLDFSGMDATKVAVSFDWFLASPSGSVDEIGAFAMLGGQSIFITSWKQGLEGELYGHYEGLLNFAPGSTGLLEFYLGPGFFWQPNFGVAGVDNVSVTPVPEPATLLLLGSGLVGLGGVAWRRNRKNR